MRVVVKVGGRALQEAFDSILDSVAAAAKENEVVFVHGGGDVVTKYCERMGIQPKFVVSPSGIRSRYTSAEELEVYVMVMAGLVNKRVVAGLVKRGVRAVGLSGADALLAVAERKKKIIVVDERGRKVAIEGGFTGKISKVNAEVLEELLSHRYVPVVAPLAVSEEGELLNVDGDQMAASIAASLKADALVFLTDVPGVVVDGTVVERVSAAEAKQLAAKVGYGMNRKLLLAAEAVEGGVSFAAISSGKVEDPVLRALRGEGSVVVP